MSAGYVHTYYLQTRYAALRRSHSHEHCACEYALEQACVPSCCFRPTQGNASSVVAAAAALLIRSNRDMNRSLVVRFFIRSNRDMRHIFHNNDITEQNVGTPAVDTFTSPNLSCFGQVLGIYRERVRRTLCPYCSVKLRFLREEGGKRESRRQLRWPFSLLLLSSRHPPFAFVCLFCCYRVFVNMRMCHV